MYDPNFPEDVNAALEDAARMNRNMLKYGSIDGPAPVIGGKLKYMGQICVIRYVGRPPHHTGVKVEFDTLTSREFLDVEEVELLRDESKDDNV